MQVFGWFLEPGKLYELQLDPQQPCQQQLQQKQQQQQQQRPKAHKHKQKKRHKGNAAAAKGKAAGIAVTNAQKGLPVLHSTGGVKKHKSSNKRGTR